MRGQVLVQLRVPATGEGPRALRVGRGRGQRPAGRAQLVANFVHELDDVWLGSRNRPGTVLEPLYRYHHIEIPRNFI